MLRAACHKGETMLRLPFISLAGAIVLGLLAVDRFSGPALVEATS